MLKSPEEKAAAPYVITLGGFPLPCPRCGRDNLHHSAVTVFDRAEDGPSVVRTKVSAGRMAMDVVDAETSGNPSLRRDGIAIQFWCEDCGGDRLELTIAQHKGWTIVEWRTP